MDGMEVEVPLTRAREDASSGSGDWGGEWAKEVGEMVEVRIELAIVGM